jgi:hypothetical protein
MSRRHPLAVVPLVVLVAALVGCSGATRIPPPEPSSAVEPLFASDEEALEAATQAYEEYLAVSYRIASKPPFVLDDLMTVTTDEYLEREKAFFETLRAEGWTLEGSSTIASADLQQWYLESNGMSVVVAYVCLDVSNVRVLDTEGNDVTPAERPDQTALEIEFVEGNTGMLVLNRSEAWSGASICS